MQGLAVSARVWCWVSKRLSQWQGWSDCTLVPAAGSWAQHQPAQKRIPETRPPHPKMQARRVKPEVGSITAVSSDCRRLKGRGHRAQEPLWHTCPFCHPVQGSGGPGGTSAHAGGFRRLKSPQRLGGRWKGDGRGRASVLPTLCAGLSGHGGDLLLVTHARPLGHP